MRENEAGRRRGPSKGDLREQAILDTARRLLATKPPERVTIDDLASGAGISRPSFYFYFPSKQAVLEALLAPIADAVDAVAHDILTTDPPSLGRLRENLAALAGLWEEHGPLLRTAFRDDASGQLREFRDRVTATLIANSTARTLRDRETGLAPQGPDARVLATVLVRALVCTLSEDPAGEGVVDTLTTVVSRSIYGRSPSELL